MAKTLRSSIDDITKKYLAKYGIKGNIKGVDELPEFIRDFGNSEMFVKTLNEAYKSGDFSKFYEAVASVRSPSAREDEESLIYDLKGERDIQTITSTEPLKSKVPAFISNKINSRESYYEITNYLSSSKVPNALMDATPEQLMQLLSAADYTDRQWQASQTSRNYLLKLKKNLGPVKDKDGIGFEKKNAFTKALKKVDENFDEALLAESVRGEHTLFKPGKFEYRTDHIDLSNEGMLLADQAARQAYSVIVAPIIDRGIDSAKVSLTDQFRLASLYSFTGKQSYSEAVSQLKDHKAKFEDLVKNAPLKDGVDREEFRQEFLQRCCAYGVFSAQSDSEFYRFALGAAAQCSDSMQMENSEVSVITFADKDGNELQYSFTRETIKHEDGTEEEKYVLIKDQKDIEREDGIGMVLHEGNVYCQYGNPPSPILLKKYEETGGISGRALEDVKFEGIGDLTPIREQRFERISTFTSKDDVEAYCDKLSVKPAADTMVIQANPFVANVFEMQVAAEMREEKGLDKKGKGKGIDRSAMDLGGDDRPIVKSNGKKEDFNLGLFKYTKWYKAQKAAMIDHIRRYCPIGALEPSKTIIAVKNPVPAPTREEDHEEGRGEETSESPAFPGVSHDPTAPAPSAEPTPGSTPAPTRDEGAAPQSVSAAWSPEDLMKGPGIRAEAKALYDGFKADYVRRVISVPEGPKREEAQKELMAEYLVKESSFDKTYGAGAYNTFRSEFMEADIQRTYKADPEETTAPSSGSTSTPIGGTGTTPKTEESQSGDSTGSFERYGTFDTSTGFESEEGVEPSPLEGAESKDELVDLIVRQTQGEKLSDEELLRLDSLMAAQTEQDSAAGSTFFHKDKLGKDSQSEPEPEPEQ